MLIPSFTKESLLLTLFQTGPGLRYKSLEKIVGKGEIACNEQFLLFPVFSTHLENFLSFS